MCLITKNTGAIKFFHQTLLNVVFCIFCSSIVIYADDATENIHYRLGVKYKNEKKYEEAIEEFRKVLAGYPENFNAYMHMAEIREAQQRSRLVIYNLKKALTYNPGWGAAHKMLAATYEKDGQIQKAIVELQQYQQSSDPAERDSLQAQIERLIGLVNNNPTKAEDSTAEIPQKRTSQQVENRNESKVNPGQIEQLFKSAVKLYDEKNRNAALSKFREVINQDSQHAGGYYYAGLIRLELGQSKMAKINFLKALSFRERDYTAHYYLGKIFAEEKKYNEAVSYLSSYISFSSFEPGKKEATELIEQYRKLAVNTKQSKPQSATAPVNKTAVAENDKEATFSVQQAVAVKNYTPLEVQIDSTLTMFTVDTLTDAGQQLLAGIREFSAGNFDKSILEFKKVLMTNPRADIAAVCIFNTGVCYLRLGLFKNAENQFQQIIDRYPSHQSAPRSHYFKALTYQQRSDLQIAEKLFRDFLQRYRSHNWAPVAFEKLGDCYSDLEQYKKAAEAYTQAEKLCSNTARKIGILFKSGNVYTNLGNEKRAIENYMSAIDLGEKSNVLSLIPDCYYRVADSYYKSKDYQKALALYTKATRKYPASQETSWGLFQIGSIFKNLKQYQNAVNVFKGLIRSFPDDYWAKQAQWKLEDSIWENEYKTVLN